MFVGRFGRVFVVLLGSDGLMVSSLRTGPGQLRSFRFTERDERARSIDPTFSQQLVAPVSQHGCKLQRFVAGLLCSFTSASSACVSSCFFVFGSDVS